MKKNETHAWATDVYQHLIDMDVTQAAYVPDAGLTKLIDMCEASTEIQAVSLTSEQEGVAMLCGAYLGGARGVLLMQSSGVGNCINMLSMTQECRIPVLILVTMRGQWAEFNPWQIPMAQSVEVALKNTGVVVNSVDQITGVGETVLAAAQLAFNTDRAAAVLIGQRIVGAKQWHK